MGGEDSAEDKKFENENGVGGGRLERRVGCGGKKKGWGPGIQRANKFSHICWPSPGLPGLAFSRPPQKVAFF